MGVVSYLMGVAAAWVNVHVAFVVYMLTPIFFIVPAQWPPSRPATGRPERVRPEGARRIE